MHTNTKEPWKTHAQRQRFRRREGGRVFVDANSVSLFVRLQFHSCHEQPFTLAKQEQFVLVHTCYSSVETFTLLNDNWHCKQVALAWCLCLYFFVCSRCVFLVFACVYLAFVNHASFYCYFSFTLWIIDNMFKYLYVL